MKKSLLLLPLLAIPLMMGCNNNTTNRKWHTVEYDEVLTVYSGNDSREFLGANYKKLEYCPYVNSGIAGLDVKFTSTSLGEKTYSFWGNSVTYVLRS